MKVPRGLNPPRPVTVPTWDLPTVLRALKSPPLGPLQSVDLRPLTLKTALQLAKMYGISADAISRPLLP